MDSSFIASLMVWYIVFLFSTTLHEAAHSFVAHRGGDPTAYLAGQVSLNPMPHIMREKFGMVVVPLLSFFLNHGRWMIGWASAPYNPYWAARHPRRAFLMSLAGPLSHLLPAGVACAGIVLGLRGGYLEPGYDQLVVSASGGGIWAALALFLGVLLELNVVLLVFNLLPVPPLDGSEVWNLFVKTEEGRLRWRMTVASYSVAGILVAWWLFPKIYVPVWVFLLRSMRWLVSL